MALQQDQNPQKDNSVPRDQWLTSFFNGYAMNIALGVAIGIALLNFANTIVKDLLSPLLGIVIRTQDLPVFTLRYAGNIFLIGDFLSALINLVLFMLVIFLLFLFIHILRRRYRSNNPISS